MTEEIKPKRVRAKHTRLKKDGTPRKPHAHKSAETEANSSTGQFKKGVSGNPDGWNFRKPTRQFREVCHTMIAEHGIKMLVNLMYDAYEKGNANEALDIIKFMTSYAYGVPTVMNMQDDPDPSTTKTNYQPQIIVARDIAVGVLESDKAYEA